MRPLAGLRRPSWGDRTGKSNRSVHRTLCRVADACPSPVDHGRPGAKLRRRITCIARPWRLRRRPGCGHRPSSSSSHARACASSKPVPEQEGMIDPVWRCPRAHRSGVCPGWRRAPPAARWAAVLEHALARDKDDPEAPCSRRSAPLLPDGRRNADRRLARPAAPACRHAARRRLPSAAAPYPASCSPAGISSSSILDARHLPCASRARDRVTPPPSAASITKFSAPMPGSA